MAGSAINQFQIEVTDATLADLAQRLRNTRWTDEVDAPPWHYGPPIAYMRRVVNYWIERYDWRAQEAALNALPHFTTEIDGQLIHFLEQTGNGPDPLPLVITHGWPGSFVEMLGILPMLTDPAAYRGRAEDAFTVVVPSIPGHGFSSRPTTPGVNYSTVADLWARLMERLGHTRFGAQGGDWGSWVSTALALQHPERVVGLHLNYLSARFRPGVSASDPATIYLT